MKLRAYLSTKGLTEQAFAGLVGVSQTAINRYSLGKRIPRPLVMNEIARITGGSVGPADFFDPIASGSAGSTAVEAAAP